MNGGIVILLLSTNFLAAEYLPIKRGKVEVAVAVLLRVLLQRFGHGVPVGLVRVAAAAPVDSDVVRDRFMTSRRHHPT